MIMLANAPVEHSRGSDTSRIVESTLRRCSQIATLPTVTARIIQLSEDPDATSEDLNRVITNDPALGVRILKLVNSAFYGMPGQICSITRAISLLGQKAVKNIAIAASLVKQFRGGVVSADFDAERLWIHSLAVATASQLLASRSRLVAADEAFLAGLIHDTGILVEMQACGKDFSQMIETLSLDPSISFRQAERERLGATHEDFGAGLCKAWNFPEILRQVTGYHHRPGELPEGQRRLPTLVHIADLLAARLGLGYARTVETDVFDPAMLGWVTLAESDIDAVSEILPTALAEAKRPFSENG